MTVTELKNKILTELTPVVGADEATAMMREVFWVLKRFKPVDIVLHGDQTVIPATVENAQRWVAQVKAGEPFQYAIGMANFMGMELKVTPAVLIPRPETAQLVDIITDHANSAPNLNVLDIGTGSGCIAIALARALPYSTVTAVDNSKAALSVAAQNVKSLRAGNVTLQYADALNLAATVPALPEPFDIIVSNPPYIAESERPEIDPRVKNYEPASALFVPDSDPLRFYRAIGSYAHGALTRGGALFFEINPLFAEQLRKMLTTQGWANVDIIRDYKGNLRFAVCTM